MRLARDFNKVLHSQVDIHAAWLPVTNTFAVGDFGVIDDGLFQRLGNIKDAFGIDFETVPGQETTLSFKSQHVRVIRVSAGGEVTAFPEGALDAKLKIEFARERSFYLKAALNVEEMKSLFTAAQRIAQQPAWNEGKYKVVSATYSGRNSVILSSRHANTVFEIGGKADALEKLELGNVEAGLSYSSTSDLGLEVTGGSGVVGLRLFKVKTRTGEAELEAVPELEISESKDWGADLEDDL